MTEIPKVKPECQLTSKIFEYINIKSKSIFKFRNLNICIVIWL